MVHVNSSEPIDKFQRRQKWTISLKHHFLVGGCATFTICKSSINTACQWPLILSFSLSRFHFMTLRRRTVANWIITTRMTEVQLMLWLWDERIIFEWYERCVHTKYWTYCTNLMRHDSSMVMVSSNQSICLIDCHGKPILARSWSPSWLWKKIAPPSFTVRDTALALSSPTASPR